MSRLPRGHVDALLADGRSDDDAKLHRVPYPSPADVLYASPNPDGSRKMCGNCYKFLAPLACVEVAGDVRPDQVCGYHVYGTPLAMTAARAPLVAAPLGKVPQATAGLVDTPDGAGTSCGNCRFFTPSQGGVGLCEAVGYTDGLPPVIVDPLGCCSRWQASPAISPATAD